MTMIEQKETMHEDVFMAGNDSKTEKSEAKKLKSNSKQRMTEKKQDYT